MDTSPETEVNEVNGATGIMATKPDMPENVEKMKNMEKMDENRKMTDKTVTIEQPEKPANREVTIEAPGTSSSASSALSYSQELAARRRQFMSQPSTVATRRQQAVCVRRAHKSYGPKNNPNVILDGLNMTVPKGAMYVIFQLV